MLRKAIATAISATSSIAAGLVAFPAAGHDAYLLSDAQLDQVTAGALEATISAQTNDLGAWRDTYQLPGGSQKIGVFVKPGDYLIFNASGKWGEGNSVSGPAGSTKLWPDNFLNRNDLGVGRYEATTPTEYHNALVGYIGDSPPAQGSYTSRDVGREAERVFPVFPRGETSSVMQVKEEGRLYLAFNADAYSNYTVDNKGKVKVSVTQDSGWRPNSDLGPLCQGLPGPFKACCWVGNQFVGGKPARGPTSGGMGQPIPQEQVQWGRLGGGIAR